MKGREQPICPRLTVCAKCEAEGDMRARGPSETFDGASAALMRDITVISLLAAGRRGCRRRLARTRRRRQRPAAGSLPGAAHVFPDGVAGACRSDLCDASRISAGDARSCTCLRNSHAVADDRVRPRWWMDGRPLAPGRSVRELAARAGIDRRTWLCLASVNYRLSSEAVSPAAEWTSSRPSPGCVRIDAPCHRYFTIRYLGRLRRRPARRTRGHIL